MSQNRTMWPQCLDELKVQGWRSITFAKVCIRLRCTTMVQCLTLVSRRLAWIEWICRCDYMAQGCDKAESLNPWDVLWPAKAENLQRYLHYEYEVLIEPLFRAACDMSEWSVIRASLACGLGSARATLLNRRTIGEAAIFHSKLRLGRSFRYSGRAQGINRQHCTAFIGFSRLRSMIDPQYRFYSPSDELFPEGSYTWNIIDFELRRWFSVTGSIRAVSEESDAIEILARYVDDLGPEIYALNVCDDDALIRVSPKDPTDVVHYPRYPVEESGRESNGEVLQDHSLLRLTDFMSVSISYDLQYNSAWC